MIREGGGTKGRGGGWEKELGVPGRYACRPGAV